MVAALSLAAAQVGHSHPTAAAAPARCCFMVSVQAAGGYTDRYEGTVSSQWKGAAAGSWYWNTRFIAMYTGHGVKTTGGEAMTDSATWSAYRYDILLNPIPPSTTLRTEHRECGPSGPEGDPSEWQPDYPNGSSFYEKRSAAKLIGAAQNVGGYARALIVSFPVRLGFACAALGGEEPGSRVANKPGGTDLQGPDLFAVKAPSVDSFLGGKSFSRSCWQKVMAHLKNPFPHDYTFEVDVGVQFTYFPQDQLKKRVAALSRLEGKEHTTSAAWERAAHGAEAAGNNASGCTS